MMRPTGYHRAALANGNAATEYLPLEMATTKFYEPI